MNGDIGTEETLRLLRRLGSMASQVVLVGGQALNFWATRYLSRSPMLRIEAPYSSHDVDFQGRRGVAVTCARILGGQVFQPTLDDATVSTGKVLYLDDAKQERQIDFLDKPHGLADHDVYGFSLPVEVEEGIEFRVMHPFHCLMSRTANVAGLPGYQSPHALKQLRASIECTRLYLVDLLDEGKVRAVSVWNERIFRFSRQPWARKVYQEHSIETFGAVLVDDARLPEQFRTLRYVVMARQIQTRRQRTAAHLLRHRKSSL